MHRITASGLLGMVAALEAAGQRIELGRQALRGYRLPATPPPVPRARRNAACPCGSGKKYKKCHGRPHDARLESADAQTGEPGARPEEEGQAPAAAPAGDQDAGAAPANGARDPGTAEVTT